MYEKNCQALLKSSPAHAALIAQLETVTPLSDEEYGFFETDDGNFTLQYKNIFLHDPDGPIKEAEETFAAQCLSAHDQVHIVLGLGLGYGLAQVFKQSPGFIVIYEPQLPLLRFLLENIDYSDTLSASRVTLASNRFDLIAQLTQHVYAGHEVDVMVLKGFAALLADEIPLMMNAVLALTEDWFQDHRTGGHFHFQWIRQFFSNVPDFATVQTTDILKDRFAGKPALVISRGPSLDNDIEAVRAAQEKCVLIAVGGAVRRLFEANIVPDFALFYDANGMQEQLSGIDDAFLSQVTFLVSPFTQRCAYEAPSRGKLVFLGNNNSHFAQFLDEAFDTQHHRIRGGGTVSLIAYQQALLMGCNPVTLIGQDLAFPNNQVYAGGIALNTNARGEMDLACTDTLYSRPAPMTTVPGQTGDSLQTLESFASFIQHFEHFAQRNARAEKPVSLFNASLGGAQIDGFTVKPLSALLSDWPVWRNGAINEGLCDLSPEKIIERQTALQVQVECLTEDIDILLKRCKEWERSLPAEGTVSVAESAESVRILSLQFYEAMQAHTFPGYMALYEMLQFKRRFKEANRTLDADAKALALRSAFTTLLQECALIWNDRARPWLETAAQGLTGTSAEGQPENRSDLSY